MKDKVSGTDRTAAKNRNAKRDQPASKEPDSKQIVRDVMRSRAFRDAKMSLTQGRRHNFDAYKAISAELSKRKADVGAPDSTRAKNPGAAKQKGAEVSIRVDTEALLESINFNEGSIEELVSKGLEGSLKKAEANLVAFELGKLINCSSYYYGMTIEKQAVNREIGMRLAEHFTQAYFDDPDEAQACLDRINSFIDRNEMLDKGYYYWEGQAYESYKPVPISIVYKLGGVHWSKETVEEFRENEKKVSETIGNARATVSNGIVTDKLTQIYANFERIKDNAGKGGDLDEVQKILDIQSLLDF